MQTSHTEQTAVVSLAHLPQLDLTAIRNKVAKEHSELTVEQLDESESRYRIFLMLCKTERDEKHEPDEDVDWFWHAHIIHTKRYADDCQRYFGYFLHHEPNAGGQGCDDGCGAAY